MIPRFHKFIPCIFGRHLVIKKHLLCSCRKLHLRQQYFHVIILNLTICDAETNRIVSAQDGLSDFELTNNKFSFMVMTVKQ